MMKKLLVIVWMIMSAVSMHAQEILCGDRGHYDAVANATQFFFVGTPKARKPVLRLYRDGIGGKPVRTQKLAQLAPFDFIWAAEVPGNWQGYYYTVDFLGDRKRWCESPGIFAKAVGVNGKRGYVFNTADTDPEGWHDDVRPAIKSPADLVIYELHHRDFSIDQSSAMQYKGKYLALTEPAAIRHLKDLGINVVHILPSYDFGSIDETRLADNKYNWGYDPVNYNVPEGSYSTDPYDPLCRIREFKQMVQALHKAGIRVILDVVYNHTYDIEHSNFQLTYPDYYYRKTENGERRTENGELRTESSLHLSPLNSQLSPLTSQLSPLTSQLSPLTSQLSPLTSQLSPRESSQYSNGSGCGNETASEQPLMRKFMIESVKYWIEMYHIDGFRFDLMGVHDIETMNEIRKAVDEIDPTLFIYGEGWSAGTCAYPSEKLGLKANIPQMPRIAAFSDELRDALRGPFSDDSQGAFLAGVAGHEESLKFGIAGAIAHPQVDMSKVNYSQQPWATEPTQMISYVSCHDDMCLTDRLRASIPGITTDELIRLDLLAQTAVFTSQGVPFMLSGEEMLRDKKGVHNSYESPDSINRLDWDNLKRYPGVFDYYKRLIALRHHHPAFRLGSADVVRKHLEFLSTPELVVAYRLKDYAGGDSWQNIIVVLNANKTPVDIAIPDGQYTVVCRDGVIDEQGVDRLTGSTVSVGAQSAVILHD